MKLCVIGLGYIGLPTSAMFASHDWKVVGVDLVPSVVETVNNGHIHIEEPELERVVKECVDRGNLRASMVPEEADVFIIAVPTPYHQDEYFSCDITYVLDGVKSILPYVRKGNTVIVESTIAPKSMDDCIKPIFEEKGFVIGKDLYLAHCPERVLPGKILYELKYNNRIVGGITPECSKHAASVYATFVEGKIIQTEAKTAELSKCMENTYRDVNIALANELVKICYELDINCLDVIELANQHPRVNIHQPGPGVGGHCLAIDPYFICAKVPDTANIIKLSRDTNKSMPGFVVDKVKLLLSGIAHPKVAAFGMAYKGNVDDVRESPAMEVIDLLKKEEVQVAVHDPHVKCAEVVSIEEAVTGADLILILTDHNEFKTMSHQQLAKKMRHAILFDTRNIIKPQEGSGLTVVNYGNLYAYKIREDEEREKKRICV